MRAVGLEHPAFDAGVAAAQVRTLFDRPGDGPRDLPAGFRLSPASRLIVPEAVSRAREVWTWQEWRDLERVSKRLAGHAIGLFLTCTEPDCVGTPMEKLHNADGGWTLRCNHKDRIVTRTI